MAERQLTNPNWGVHRRDDGMVEIRLWVPGSKWGTVAAILDPINALLFSEVIDATSRPREGDDK